MKNNSEVIFIKRENSKRKKLVKILKIVKTESFELDENLLDTSEDFFFLEDLNISTLSIVFVSRKEKKRIIS